MRVASGIAAASLVAVGLVVGLPVSPASADSIIKLTAEADNSLLVGESASVTLTAANVDSVVDYFNMSFRYELPSGVKYQDGTSKTANSTLPDPRVITITDPGPVTRDILIWSNAFDLPHQVVEQLTFSVTPDATRYPVGSSFGGDASVYGQTDPRTIPKFHSATGVASDFDGSDFASDVPTEVEAIAIKITEEKSPELELMRGIHEQATVFTVTVENNGVAPTTGVTVVDYLPAELEFLGCGEPDNGTAEEYSGSGLLGGADAGANCIVPDLVETVQNPAGLTGIFTKVTWQNIDLGIGATKVITYAAGIPLQANEMWTGAPPAAQASNLDNNTGASTRQEAPAGTGQALTTTATATGHYTGAVASPADADAEATDALTVRAMDLAISKTASAETFDTGSTATYSLLVRAGEYTNDSSMTIEDTIPNGLCPLVPSTVVTTGANAGNVPAECKVTGAVANAEVTSLVANTDGSFVLTMTPNPGTLAANGEVVISYDVYMGVTYLGDIQGGPTVAGDGFVNTVEITGTTTDVAVSPEITVPVSDSSEATLASAAPTIEKKILPRMLTTDGVACSAETGYLANDEFAPGDVPDFQLGDKICFELTVNFSTSAKTLGAQLTDLVPVGTTYVGYEEVVGASVPVTPVAGSQSDGVTPDPTPASWNLGTLESGEYYVEKGAVLRLYVEALVTSNVISADVDITANLMKYRQKATDGTVIALRDQVDYFTAVPVLTLDKKIVEINSVATANQQAAAQVKQNDLVKFAIDISNVGGYEANNIEVWDALPAGVDCDGWTFVSISPTGSCVDDGDVGHPASADVNGRSVIVWTLTGPLAPTVTSTLTYTVKVPTEVSVSTKFINNASVVKFTSPNTAGGDTEYFPLDSLDADAAYNTFDANDAAMISTPDASVTKVGVSHVGEANNNVAAQVVAGELVDYTYSVTIPAGTSVYNATMYDDLPSGLTQTGSSVVTATLDGGALPSGVSVDSTGLLTFPFTTPGSAPYNNTTPDDQVFAVTTSNVQVGVGLSSGTLTNTAIFTSSVSAVNDDSLPPRTADDSMAVRTPLPHLTKSVAPTSAATGVPVTFTIKAWDQYGRPPAHDTEIVDCLPNGLNFVSYGTLPSGVTTDGATAGTGSNGCATTTTRLAWHVGSLSPTPDSTPVDSEKLLLSYTAEIDPLAAGLVDYVNSAKLTASSLANAMNDSLVERVVTDDDTATVTVQGAATTKTVDKPHATVGETVNYGIAVTLPKNVNFYDAAIIDVLPAGVTQTGVASVSCETVETTPVDCKLDLPEGGDALPTSGQNIGWLLGSVTAGSVDRLVTITFDAEIDSATTGNVAGVVRTNSAALKWNESDKTDPTTAGATFDKTGTAGTIPVTIDEPKLTIDKSVLSASPEPGEVFTYTVKTSNGNTATTSTAYDVTIVDAIPAGIDITSIVTADGTLDEAARTITWTVASIAKNASATFTYTAKLAASSGLSGTAIVNTVKVTEYLSLDGDGRSYTANPPTDTAAVTPDFPHIALAKSVASDSIAYVDDAFGWVLNLTNTGSGTAKTVTATDVLPQNWEYVDGSATVSYNGAAAVSLDDPTKTTAAGTQTLVWDDFLAMAPASTIVIWYSATPTTDALIAPGFGSATPHTNTLSADATDATDATGHAGPVPYAAAPVTADAQIHNADLQLVKTPGSALVAGTTTSDAWKIVVTNNGAETAVGPFAVTDTPALATGLTVTGASGTGWTCSVPDADGAFTCARTTASDTLLKDASFPAINVAVAVTANVVSGTAVDNVASVKGKTYDSDPTNNEDNTGNELTVTTSADLSVTKTVNGTLTAGQPASWNIVVSNAGPSLSRYPITVTDTFPTAGIDASSVEATGIGWDCDDPTATEVVCEYAGTAGEGIGLTSLPAITVTADIDSDFVGTLANTAVVTGTTTDPGPGVNTETVSTSVNDDAALTLVKSLIGAKIVPGAIVQYAFTVQNTKTPDARNVVITDALPDGLTFDGMDASSSAGWDCEADVTLVNVTCDIATLTKAAGAQTIVIRVNVPSDLDLTTTVINTATITADNAPTVSDSHNSALTGESDLSIAKWHSDPVYAGNTLDYGLVVTNNGPSDAPIGTIVVDHLPAGLVLVSAAGVGWACDPPVGQDVTCTSTVILQPGDDAEPITVTVDIPADAGPATYDNVATVNGVLSDTVLTNNTATDSTEVMDLAAVTIVKSAAAATVVAGESTQYTLAVTNAGPSVADAVSVTDTLPAGFTATAISGAGWTCALATVTCTRSSLAVTTVNITVTATASASIPNNTVATNTVEVSWQDSRLVRNTASDSADITVIAVADLLLKKTVRDSTLMAGENAIFDLQLSNIGSSDAVGPVTIVDTLPAGIRFLSNSTGWTCTPAPASAADPQIVTCALDDPTAGIAASGAALPLVLMASTDPELGTVTLQSPATGMSASAETTLVNNDDTVSVTFAQSADLNIVKTHSGTGRIGDTVSFTLVVSNDGPSTAVGVELVDILPAGLTYQTVIGTGWACIASATDPVTGETELNCSYAATLAPSASSTDLVVTAEVAAAAYPSVENVATVSAATPDPELADNTATDSLEVDPLVALAVQKSHTGVVRVGQSATYLIEVSNNGLTEDPGGFTIVDDLPAGLDYLSFEGIDVTCVAVTKTVTCTFDGPLAIGQTRSVKLSTMVLASASPKVVNTVTADSQFEDLATLAIMDADSAPVLEALPFTGLASGALAWLIAMATLLLLAGATLMSASRGRVQRK